MNDNSDQAPLAHGGLATSQGGDRHLPALKLSVAYLVEEALQHPNKVSSVAGNLVDSLQLVQALQGPLLPKPLVGCQEEGSGAWVSQDMVMHVHGQGHVAWADLFTVGHSKVGVEDVEQLQPIPDLDAILGLTLLPQLGDLVDSLQLSQCRFTIYDRPSGTFRIN